MNRRNSTAAVFLLFLLLSALLPAEELVVGTGRYYLDPPKGWRTTDGLEGSVQTFTDVSGTAFLQVFAFQAGSYGPAAEFHRSITQSLGATSEGAPFSFSGRPAVLSDLVFKAGSQPVRGYGLFVQGEDIDYALMAFTSQTLYGTHHDALLSVLDSFAYLPEERFLPGPISQFYYPYPADRDELKTVQMGDTSLELALNRQEGGATQVLIEREARILAADEILSLEAWRRYYRVIYRDNVARLADFSAQLAQTLQDQPPRIQAERILAWIQGFHYYRTGTLSDLTSPLTCLVTTAGDCDSRALLYVTFLHRMGIDAVLLVSTEYGHSAVGVDVEGAGARLTIGEKSYVFAEVTDDVALGMVDRSMADPAGWIPIPLGSAATRVRS